MTTTLLDERAMHRIAQEAAERTRGQIRAGVGLDGQLVAPRADGTRGPMVESGGLVDSIEVLDVRPGEALVGSRKRYAPFVDAARPVIGLAPASLDALEDVVVSELDAAIEGLA